MRDERLTAEGIFDRFVNRLYFSGSGVWRDFVQCFVKLRPQSIGRNVATNGDLHECGSDSVERRSGLNLRKTKVDFRFCSLRDFYLFHVAYDANDAHLSEPALAHGNRVANGILILQIAIDKSLIYDSHYWTRRGVAVSKESAAHHGDTQRFHKPR